jgi:hypothetical protein
MASLLYLLIIPDQTLVIKMKKSILALFILFIAPPLFGQDLITNSSPKNVHFSLNKKYEISQNIRGSMYVRSGSIFLFFLLHLVPQKDTLIVNASVKKVILQSTIANQTRIFDSQKIEDSTSEMSYFIKRLLESSISMNLSSIDGELISIDTSKAVRFLTLVQWDNFFDDFYSYIFNFTSFKAKGSNILCSKNFEGLSEEINYLLDSSGGTTAYLSFSGNRKTKVEKKIAGSDVLQEYDFSISGTMKVDTATHLVLSKKTNYTGKGSLVMGNKKDPVELNQIIESVISFPVD